MSKKSPKKMQSTWQGQIEVCRVSELVPYERNNKKHPKKQIEALAKFMQATRGCRIPTWFYDGIGFTRKVQWFHPSKPESRMREAKQSMACTEAELRRGFVEHDPPNWRVRYAYRNQARNAYETFLRKIGCRA